jgi:hypothetical protein
MEEDPPRQLPLMLQNFNGVKLGHHRFFPTASGPCARFAQCRRAGPFRRLRSVTVPLHGSGRAHLGAERCSASVSLPPGPLSIGKEDAGEGKVWFSATNAPTATAEAGRI